jgi:hypothetical protein
MTTTTGIATAHVVVVIEPGRNSLSSEIFRSKPALWNLPVCRAYNMR